LADAVGAQVFSAGAAAAVTAAMSAPAKANSTVGRASFCCRHRGRDAAGDAGRGFFIGISVCGSRPLGRGASVLRGDPDAVGALSHFSSLFPVYQGATFIYFFSITMS
jgi:hypothetical protein